MRIVEQYVSIEIIEIIRECNGIEVYKAAYKFAYSEKGMDKNRNEAEKFADWWIENHSEKDFLIYAIAYRFAYMEKGMDKNRRDAESFADKWIKSAYHCDFEKFAEFYLFAYSSSGMDKNRNEAESFAWNKI